MPNKRKSIDQKIAAIDNNPRLNKKMERKYVSVAKKTEAARNNPAKLKKIEKTYGYNHSGAARAGMKPDSTGHMGSLGVNGQVLKGRKHPSISKTIKTERVLGNKIVKVAKERYSVPKKGASVFKKEIKDSIKIIPKLTQVKRKK